jgi:hypothetical protein
MILVQIATALAIGAYVVLSKDAKHKRLDATPRESLRLRHSVLGSIVPNRPLSVRSSEGQSERRQFVKPDTRQIWQKEQTSALNKLDCH